MDTTHQQVCFLNHLIIMLYCLILTVPQNMIFEKIKGKKGKEGRGRKKKIDNVTGL